VLAGAPFLLMDADWARRRAHASRLYANSLSGANDASLPKTDAMAFERKLYVIRRRIENAVKSSREAGDRRYGDLFYSPVSPARTVVYKGMLRCAQLEDFYPELHDPEWKPRWQ